MFINHDQFVAPLDHAKYVTCSSLLFFIPCIYAFIKEQYLLSASLFFAGLLSANYWRHPTYSSRRIADHISAKVSFIICIVTAFYLYPVFVIPKLICLGLVFYCYYMSEKYCNCNIHINNISINYASLLINYLYFDIDEKNYFINNKLTYMIDYIQYDNEKRIISANDKININYNNLCKELIFVS